MAYTNAQATPRADINAFVEEAMAADGLFIADKIFPVVFEPTRTGIYMRARKQLAELLNSDGHVRTPGSAYPRVNPAYETDTYDTAEYGLETVIDDSYSTDVGRFFSLEQTEAKIRARSLWIGYETRVAAAAQSTTNFTQTSALVAYTEANLATINLPGDVAATKNKLYLRGEIPNTIVMSSNVYERIRRSTLLQNQVFGVVPKTAGQVTLPGEADVANALGVQNLYVGRAPYNIAKKGLAYNGGFIWSDSYILVCNVQSGIYNAGGVGRTIVWQADSPGLIVSESYRDDIRRSNILRVRQSVAEKVINAAAGELITTSYS